MTAPPLITIDIAALGCAAPSLPLTELLRTLREDGGRAWAALQVSAEALEATIRRLRLSRIDHSPDPEETNRAERLAVWPT
jgi:hypothetical protein